MDNQLKCNVVMLPVDEKTVLFLKHDNTLEFNLNPPIYGIRNLNWKYQHLYITSDREIEEGDYFIDCTFKINRIHKCVNGLWGKQKPINCKKIEASTNISLELPLISELFIKNYAEAQGKINEINIEMEYLDNGWDEKSVIDRLYKIKTIDNFVIITIK